MVATALSDLAEDDAVFSVDTGMCNVWGARYLEMKPGRRILASFSHGSMANAMPQAIGAKVGSPDRQVIALCGDGGFSMLMGELLTAAGLDIPVKLMVFNNSTLGMVRAEMMVVGYQPWGTDVKNPDFGALATAAGVHGERVENAADIRPAIERAFAHPGPALIDFVTDPRALAVPPHTTIEEVKGFALTTGEARLQRRRRRGLAAGEVQHPRRGSGPVDGGHGRVRPSSVGFPALRRQVSEHGSMWSSAPCRSARTVRICLPAPRAASESPTRRRAAHAT